MKKPIAIVVVLVLLSLLGWRVYVKARAHAAGAAGPGAGRGQAVPIEVGPVSTGLIRDVAFFTGSLRPRSEFTVAPKVSGRLEQLLVNIGDRVSRGQVVAVLDDDEYVLEVEQSRAELEVAEANLIQTESALAIGRREYERVQALREKGIASESDLDAAEANFQARTAAARVAAAQVAQRRAALQSAQVRQSYTQIAVDWEDGADERLVGERFVDEGALLRANDPIVSILDLNTLTAALHVIERDYTKVQPGQEVMVTTDAFPEETFSGRVVRVAPLLRETSRQARVEVELPNPQGLLKPGMFVRASIEFGRVENATTVPSSALARRDGRFGVFQTDESGRTVRFVPVVQGTLDGDRQQILEPALTGTVVILGHHLLEDGSAVTVVTDADESGAGERAAS
ncbi:MAG: efflux RND transporter periplasmic adaptor subunit [Candidatus Brocadiaceae bacterium]|mgnify:CR=1 FL=1|nr:efflux RND transporter periplasmic adaptor subunit [Candidatus Brocadiaceae bacterium]